VLDHPFLRGVADPTPSPRRVGSATGVSGQSPRGGDGETCLLCGLGRAGGPAGGVIHTCVHGDGSHMVMSECNSRASTPAPPSESPRPPVLTPCDTGMFKESALGDVRLWESEMHARVAHTAHSDRSDGDAYSARSLDHGRDSSASMYADTYSDITSFYL
ncbi:hypothetical protein H4R19_006717, partial [Coemansia spiralis]